MDSGMKDNMTVVIEKEWKGRENMVYKKIY